MLQAINLGNSGNEGEDGGNPCGLVAGDEESYELFAGLFGPLITEHHGFYPADSHYEGIVSIISIDVLTVTFNAVTHC